MEQVENFINNIQEGYRTKGDFIHLGPGMLNRQAHKEAAVKIPLKTLNRHGLIAGATGTGKTKTLQILAEIYTTFPEQGDTDKPKLVLFIDEAHLIFKEASDALLDRIESIVKLIRSKGIGLFFVTQNPTDVPSEVLGQLRLKIQHALRAFTAKDRKAIKLTAENYPISEFYDTKNELTSLGIGEALVSALDEKGRLGPLASTLLRAPMSRMDILTEEELQDLISNSQLRRKYNETIDRESTCELLNRKIEIAEAEEAREKAKDDEQKRNKKSSGRTKGTARGNNTEGKIIKSFNQRYLY